MTPPVPATHAGPAWLVTGPRAEPGVLALRPGWLRLTVADGVVFDEPLARVRAVDVPGPDLLDLVGVDQLDLLTTAGSLDDEAAGRRRARTWRTLLDPR